MTTSTEYINEINKLLKLADEELLDFVFQLLQKSVTPYMKDAYQVTSKSNKAIKTNDAAV